jgi:hypothetical protein
MSQRERVSFPVDRRNAFSVSQNAATVTSGIKPYGYIVGACWSRCAAQLVDLSVLSRSEN